MDDSDGRPGLRRALGRPEAIALVLGSVIGSGIFFKPQRIAQELGSFEWILSAWVVAGLVCLFGALSLGELAAMLPRAGGLYVYLREAYGRLCAFLYGWSLFVVVRPAATGALATAFAASVPVSDGAKFAIAVSVIAVLAWINVMGVVWGGRTQNATTVIKAGFLLAIAVLPWLCGDIDSANFASAVGGSGGGAGDAGIGAGGTGDASPPLGTPSAASFMVALLAVLFAYNSWHEVTPLAEEMRAPQRDVPWALGVGVAALVVLYAGANVAYHGVLSMDEVRSEQNPNTAATLMDRMFGPVGGTVMTVLVMCSVFGTINANLLHAPRVYFAMGRDGVFFRALAWLHRERRTPVLAITAQAALAVGLTVVATFIADRGVFDLLTNIVVFGSSVFYALAVLAVVVLRIRRPALERPYRALGYPVTPLLFVAAYAVFLPMILVDRPVDSGIGLGVIAAGVPVYLFWRRRATAATVA